MAAVVIWVAGLSIRCGGAKATAVLPAINDRMIARIAPINSVLCCSELCSGYGSLVAISEACAACTVRGRLYVQLPWAVDVRSCLLASGSIKKLAYTLPH